MGEIGDTKRDVPEGLFDFSQLPFGFLDAIPQLLHCRHGRFSRFFGSSQPSHLFRALIELVPELLDLRRNGSSFFAQFLDISPRDVVPASSESSADVVKVFAEMFQIVHRSLSQRRVESST